MGKPAYLCEQLRKLESERDREECLARLIRRLRGRCTVQDRLHRSKRFLAALPTFAFAIQHTSR